MTALALGDFAGVWRLSRRITTPEGALTGTFEGTLTFVPGEGGLVADEAGVMRLAEGPPLQAGRRLIWRQAGARIAVFFGDGRPFHDFDPAAPVAEHVCDPDLYRVRYDFARFPDWRAVWSVTGPRKDYVMTSDHRRDAALV
jgi:hypothetical protein